uniref:Putative secreted protein n=1 Tax=Anopheles marajoara TaxID=58244 RepID=A0A2M4CBU2_9DIPT
MSWAARRMATLAGRTLATVIVPIVRPFAIPITARSAFLLLFRVSLCSYWYGTGRFCNNSTIRWVLILAQHCHRQRLDAVLGR